MGKRIYDKSVKNINTVSSYICKYMTKGEVDERLLGQKSYFTSKGLIKPVEILDKERIENIIKNIPEAVEPYENKFKSEFCEEIKYKRYDLAKHKEKKERLDILIEYDL